MDFWPCSDLPLLISSRASGFLAVALYQTAPPLATTSTSSLRSRLSAIGKGCKVEPGFHLHWNYGSKLDLHEKLLQDRDTFPRPQEQLKVIADCSTLCGLAWVLNQDSASVKILTGVHGVRKYWIQARITREYLAKKPKFGRDFLFQFSLAF